MWICGDTEEDAANGKRMQHAEADAAGGFLLHAGTLQCGHSQVSKCNRFVQVCCFYSAAHTHAHAQRATTRTDTKRFGD
jgi:hypothetical protein